MEHAAECKQCNGAAGSPRRLQHSGTGRLLLRRFEIRDEAMDIVEFAFCDTGQCQLPDGLSAPGVPLPDGIRFNVQLLLDQLFELRDAFPLLRRRSGQGM